MVLVVVDVEVHDYVCAFSLTIEANTVYLHFCERSWRARKGRRTGPCSLMQQIYMVGSKGTFRDVPSRAFARNNGSTKSDVVGPVALDSYDDIPHVAKDDKLKYLGSRRVRPGDRLSDSESEGHHHHHRHHQHVVVVRPHTPLLIGISFH